jgi:hypothetical protein
VPEPGAATVTIVDQPLAPPAAPPSPASRPDGRTAGRTAPDAATTPVDSSRSRRPSGAVLLLGALALIAAVAAVLGWSRDPSKDRAVSAETQVQELEASLAKSDESLATTEAELGRRTTELTAAKAQLAATGSIVRAQFAGASLPQKFSLTGGVAPGSCTLTGEACTVATTVRNITLSCTGATCECAAGSCTVTSDLWKTAAPVAYDAATGLYTAKGNLDADLFRCAGVPQPTTFELRFRVTKITWSSTTWVANGLEAELAQASSASDCLAGNRTYALSGPAA